RLDYRPSTELFRWSLRRGLGVGEALDVRGELRLVVRLRLRGISEVIAKQNLRVGWQVLHGRLTVGRGRLLRRGHSIDPHPTHALRRTRVRGNSGLPRTILLRPPMLRLSAGGQNGDQRK